MKKKKVSVAMGNIIFYYTIIICSVELLGVAVFGKEAKTLC